MLTSADLHLEPVTGMSRRGFLQFCSGVAVTLGLSPSAGAQIAEAVMNPRRPPVIWLSAQECTGCTESLLRAHHPTLENLILDMISLDYHETLSVAAGHQAEAARQASMRDNFGSYLLVVDGSIPIKDGGIYCKVADRPIKDHVLEAAEGAAAIIAIGSCASWGGIPSSGPNPTGAVGVAEFLPGKTIVNVPGCPPNPYNFLSTVLQFVAFGTLPALDEKGRPKFAYGRLIHENCERRPHFDAGRFALEFGDEGHRQGWCLYKLGCRGPTTYNACASMGWNEGVSFPIKSGHGCIGCSEEGYFDRGPFYERLPDMQQWGIESNADKVAVAGAAALGGAIAVQAVATMVKRVVTGKRAKDSGKQSEGGKPEEGKS